MDEEKGCDSLELIRIIGFNGTVKGGLQMHTDNKHLVYPLGCNIIIEDVSTGKPESVLAAHTDTVSCIAIDNSGKYIASGQVTYMGFKAAIVLWDYETKKPICELTLHKVKIEALAFTLDTSYLISLGGRDDGAVVIWNLAKHEALCGAPAQVESAGITHCLGVSKTFSDIFVTAGNDTLRIWQLDAPNRKIRPTDVQLGGGTKREVVCIEVADHLFEPGYVFCGTTSGDILAVNIKSKLLQFLVPTKERFSLGVTALSLVTSPGKDTLEFLLGTGDGLLGRYEMKISRDKKDKIVASLKHKPGLQPWQDEKQPGKTSAITSIAKRGKGHMFFVGTENSQIYRFNFAELTADLIKTCHWSQVNDIAFPNGFSEVIVTCQHEEVRVWHLTTGKELRRYKMANMTCNALCIDKSGKLIFTAWNDGKVRVLGFGKNSKTKQLEMVEKFTIQDAHNKGVTAIAVTTCGTKLITGGGEGQVRIWKLTTDLQTGLAARGELVANMKEHKGSVTAIQIHPEDKECVTASTDGSTIVWDIITCTRRQIFLANTLFKCVCYGAKGVHILTSGTDRKVAYWNVYDGTQLRELEGSKGPINAMDISCDSTIFVTGGEQKLLKVSTYEEGTTTYIGVGHSAAITKARICPTLKYIVSCGTDGAIFVWSYPL